MREKKTLEKKIEKEKEQVEKGVWHFSNQDFCSAEDGLKALRKLEKKWKYHKVKGIEVVEKRKRKGGGRGRFIIATDELDSEKLSDEEALKAYKCGAPPHDPASPVRA